VTSIAIVGVGAIYPGAGSAPEFWRNILAGVDAITDVPPHRWDPEVYYDPGCHAKPESGKFYCRRGGFIDELATFDPARFGIMPAAVEGMEPDQLLALRTAAEAIADAGGDAALPDRSRVGVVIGRGGYITPGQARFDQRVTTAHQMAAAIRDLIPDLGDEQVELIRQAFLDKLGGDRPDGSIGLVPNFAASRIANRFDFRGPAYTVDAACASSLLALEQAVRMLESGQCDAMLAGAVHHAHHATVWSVFTQLKALSVQQRIRPFDAHADGTLLAEGTGMLLLKRLADARKAGDRIYAVVRGVGASSDGRASSLMSPLADGQVLAVERAWQDAGLDPRAPGALGLVEAHGTATPVGDQVELETLRRVFGAEGPQIGLGTVKSMIGHSMPAAGMAGLIKAAYALHDRVLPPTLIDDPHPVLAGSRFRLVTEAREWGEGSAPRRAGVNAFGFGGANAHVVLEEPPTRSRGAIRRAVREAGDEPVLRLAAADLDALAELLARPDEELIGQATCELDYLRTARPAGCRLAIVAPDARRLDLARTIVARGTAWRGRGDIWFSPAPMLAGGGKTAFMFPGFEPVFEPRVDDIADRFGLARPELTGRSDLVGHATDVIAVGRTLAAALRELGIEPDLAAGHSLGEWTAMVVTGMYPPDAVDAYMSALDHTTLDVPDVAYAALGCGAERAGAVIEDIGGVVVSHDNCPHQSVICGPPELVRQALDRLWAEGVLGQELPFRSGFHTPMARAYMGPVHESFRRLPLRRPEIPLWSGTTVDRFPAEPDEIQALIVRHLLEPVRFSGLVRRLHDEGVRAFVQVGPGSLTGFVGDALADPAREHLALAVNVPKRDGMAQLARVVAALWTEGYGHQAQRPGMRLDLGSPLVRLDGLPFAMLHRETPRPGSVADSPLMAEFDALLRDATATARTVLDAHRTSTARTELTTQRVFSVAAMPYVMDHCLIPQRTGWPDPADRFPVVPLTTLLEVMADTARELCPDAVVIGFEKVRALRWVIAEPATTATVRAKLEGPGRVKVVIEGHTDGTVLVADRYPRPAVPDRTPLTGEAPAPVPAHRFYEERWMFHGPRYQGVTEISTLAQDGLRAALTSLPTPGALMDSAGQLCGHWIQVHGEKDQTVFPIGIDRVTWYGPLPPQGERLELTVWNRALSETTIRCDAEMVDRHGRVWGRIDGWTTHRFYTDEPVWRMKFTPEVSGIGEPQDGGWVLARKRWDNSSARDLLMRQYLCAPERAEYERLTPRAQGPWLLGRIAAKDAVRNWLWDRGHGPLFPAELRVDGATVTGPYDGELTVVVAANPEVAGAAVAPTGVDLVAEIERDAPEGGVIEHQTKHQRGEHNGR
jgi:acyl transferase domain-containing protein